MEREVRIPEKLYEYLSHLAKENNVDVDTVIKNIVIEVIENKK